MSFELLLPLIPFLTSGLTLSFPLALVATKFMRKSLITKFSYFICAFSIGALGDLADPFIPGSLQFTFLVHGIVLVLFINVNARNYLKSSDISLTIVIVFTMFIHIVTGAVYILMPWYLSSDVSAYNITMLASLIVFAIAVRKNIDKFLNTALYDIKLGKVNLATKIMIVFIASFLVPVLFSNAVETDTVEYYYGMMLIFALMIIMGSYYRRYLCERTIRLVDERRKVAVELMRREVEAENVNKRYDEIINFKHYTSSLYRSMIEFILADDMPGLEKYYSDNIAPINEMLNKEIGEYKQVRYIHSTLIRSRIIELINDVSKLHNINLYIWIENIISEVSMEDMDLFLILNIYINNAFEEVKDQEKGEITIWMTQTYDRFIFEIKNTFVDCECGLSPRGANNSIEIISKIRESYPNVSMVTNVKYGMYSQKLEVEHLCMEAIISSSNPNKSFGEG